MKIKVSILIFISILLTCCAPETPTQESQVDVVEIATNTPAAEAPTQAPVPTESPVETEEPTEVSTETPPACITLLTPITGEETPPLGKVTFSWTPVNEAGKYILNIILPTGGAAAFETNQSFKDRYMEAFAAGGEYQWQVKAIGKDGSELCASDFAAFEKPAGKKPKGGGGNNGQPTLPPTKPPPIDEG